MANHGILKRWIGVMITAGVITLAGCQTDRPGVKNVAGTLTAYLDAPPRQVTEAAKATVEDMKLIMISSDSTSMDGRVVARTARDQRVHISIQQYGQNVSRVTIRVGMIGDEAYSQMILKKIESRLSE